MRIEVGAIAAMCSPFVHRQGVAPFWELDNQLLGNAFGIVVLGELGSQAAGLHADERVKLGVEVGLAAEDLRGNLVFLYLNPGLILSTLSEVAEQFAKGLRAMEGVARDQPIHRGLKLQIFLHDRSRYINVTAAYQLAHIDASERFIGCNRIKRTETCVLNRKVE